MKWFMTLLIVWANIFYNFGQGLNFLTSENAAIKKAKLENKFIFVDVTADWCQPCKLMLREIESDSQVVGFMNRNFINLQINEKVNKPFMKIHNIKGLPTILYMSKDGIVLNKYVGYRGINHLFENAQLMQNLIKNYNAIFSNENYGIETFDEDKFVENVSIILAQLPIENKNQIVTMLLEKGDAYTKAMLYNFESYIDYRVFDDYYKKVAKKGDLKLAEKLLIAHLNSDDAFQSNVEMRAKIKEISEQTEMEERKLMTYVMAYKEFYFNKVLNLSNQQNLYVNAKNLLQIYPETTDIELLYTALIEVVKGDTNPTFLSNLETNFAALASISQDYHHYDILSIIHYIQGNPDYTKDISKANEVAFAKNVKFLPSLRDMRQIIDEKRDVSKH